MAPRPDVTVHEDVDPTVFGAHDMILAICRALHIPTEHITKFRMEAGREPENHCHIYIERLEMGVAGREAAKVIDDFELVARQRSTRTEPFNPEESDGA